MGRLIEIIGGSRVFQVCTRQEDILPHDGDNEVYSMVIFTLCVMLWRCLVRG